MEALSTRWPQNEILSALGKTTLISRGPKPVAVLKAFNLKPQWVAPEPNTWKEVLALLDSEWPVSQKRIFVQEYGARNDGFLEALRAKGAEVIPVPVYSWQLPDDIEPMKRAIEEIVAGNVDCALFTSGHQIENVFHVARESGSVEELRRVLKEVVVIASVGPVTNEILKGLGLPVDICPERPKMGHLIKAVAGQARDCVQKKQGHVGK